MCALPRSGLGRHFLISWSPVSVRCCSSDAEVMAADRVAPPILRSCSATELPDDQSPCWTLGVNAAETSRTSTLTTSMDFIFRCVTLSPL